jgi:Cd2+/Zn2+-exporting ATPase
MVARNAEHTTMNTTPTPSAPCGSCGNDNDNSALRLDMNVLMTVAVTGAWLVSEGAEGAVVVFLFALSELLESWSVGRARRAIAALLKLTPQTALVRGEGDGFYEKPVAEVAVGSEISVRSGSSIPLDGEVIAGAPP